MNKEEKNVLLTDLANPLFWNKRRLLAELKRRVEVLS
jgi:hypothetical protein|tara:strand:- start:80 stop:190 length:111 start_codon:yes stop_codon:yes gene_type:complete